jgi:hypothetical protein
MLINEAPIQSGIHWFLPAGDMDMRSTALAVEPEALLIVKVPFILFTAGLACMV